MLGVETSPPRKGVPNSKSALIEGMEVPPGVLWSLEANTKEEEDSWFLFLQIGLPPTCE